ncbi:MAG: hypothetical protein JWN85_2321 [Gammaproteobacteria bacterium]|nr:hypothetical protein [Gammaproteobacteria bacterium]
MGAAGGKLGNGRELLPGVELVHLGELVALVVVGGGEAVVGLAEQVEALLDGAEAGDFGVAGIDGGPVAGGAEDDVGVGGAGLAHERGKISVKADGAHQATVGRVELAESAVGGARVCGFGSGGETALEELPGDCAAGIEEDQLVFKRVGRAGGPGAEGEGEMDMGFRGQGTGFGEERGFVFGEEINGGFGPEEDPGSSSACCSERARRLSLAVAEAARNWARSFSVAW